MPPKSYTFEDLSGTAVSASGNPYDGLLDACHNDPTQIQTRYTTHRETRGKQQREKLLAKNFPGVILDPILLRLSDPAVEPGYIDPRHCLVFWARPPPKIKTLIVKIQSRLLTVAPKLWLMPRESLHMTALEITHSLSSPEILSLVDTLQASIPAITDYTLAHRARLVKPLLTYDAQALALSFLPAAGEALAQSSATGVAEEDAYTYHHLRRDLYAKATAAGVEVQSRYVVPSAHLTIGRFIYDEFRTSDGAVDHAKIEALAGVIEAINDWLRDQYWPGEKGIQDGGEWIVGEEKGLDCRQGSLWYGGGETVRLGKGF